MKPEQRSEAPMGEGDGAITLSDGRYTYRFVCHSQKERNRSSRLFDKEKGTIAWIDRELRPGDVFYDVGANIGTFTIFAGHRLDETGALVAFEPHIPNANSLIENILLNGLQRKTQLVTAALTNDEGYNRFNYHSMYAGASTSQYGRHAYEGQSYEPQFVEIKHGCTIDGLCRRKIIRPPDMVKIDVDGLDFEVLDGMRELMASADRPRSIQIELGTESTPKIMQRCQELGYVLQERHWTQAGLDFIAQGHKPEEYPHYGIFHHPDVG
jgi:FkbM family methyltransferase